MLVRAPITMKIDPQIAQIAQIIICVIRVLFSEQLLSPDSHFAATIL
jgi:hypothetical protein